MEEDDKAVAPSKTEGNPIRSDSVGFSRRAWLAIIILLLVIGLAVALWARSYCRSYPGVTIGFLYVGPYTGRGIASSFEVTKLTAWQQAKFYWRSFQQGTRARWMGGYTWLETDLENYVNRTGQRVFVACEIKSTKIPQYNVSAFTEAGFTREYERFMSAHGFVFLREPHEHSLGRACVKGSSVATGVGQPKVVLRPSIRDRDFEYVGASTMSREVVRVFSSRDRVRSKAAASSLRFRLPCLRCGRSCL